MRSRALLILGVIAFGTLPAAAQPGGSVPLAGQPQRYVPFPFDVNAEALVQDRLNQLKNRQQAQDLIQKLLRDANRFHLDNKTRDALQKLNLNDPRVQERLKPWVEKSSQGQPAVSSAELKKLEEAIEKAATDQKAPPPPSPPEGPSAGSTHVGSPPEEAPRPPDAEEGVRDWLKRVLERAEESNVGEWLRESPAFQKALHELQGSAHMPDIQPHRWGLDRFLKLDKLPMPDAATLERLGRFQPKLPHIEPPSLPSLSRPSLPAVSAPSMPPPASLGTLATWLLCVAMVALLAWQASRWIQLPGRAGRTAAQAVGPWPVRPSEVSTRTELVQAFDYLALLRCGVTARSWHHRAVARALAEHTAGLADDAAQLAALYEQARYTDGAEALALDLRDQARTALVRLAGVAA
jgi:hypothetical protein